jgi:hypothetical protein
VGLAGRGLSPPWPAPLPTDGGSGEERWKKLTARECTIWARFMTRRSFKAASGGVTARISSHAFADAMM